MPLFPNGVVRYNTLYTFRNDLNNIIGDSSGKTLFPYARQFLNWEEVGIIKEELIRNLIIASGVICVIICMLIPKPRISFLVILNILASVIEVVGISHFWGQTFNGVTTIYFLICVGLGVDYSAHIGHIFKDSKGKCEDRAHDALQRIGPSVLNALISTAMAVIILGFAKSFVFEVFFRVLFLVACISGSHGVLLLPVLLSIAGGDAVEDTKGDTSKKFESDVVGKDESKITGSNEDAVTA
jgi:multidrug efflux pump subunit AcrB